MKLLIVLLLLLVNGCNKETLYDKYLKEIKSTSTFSENIPFDIRIQEDSLGEEIMYQVVIDNPTEEITDLRCLAYTNQSKGILPNIGLFENSYTLVKDNVDVSSNRVKGVSLVGYFEPTDKVEYRVICKYQKNSKVETIYYQYLTN